MISRDFHRIATSLKPDFLKVALFKVEVHWNHQEEAAVKLRKSESDSLGLLHDVKEEVGDGKCQKEKG